MEVHRLRSKEKFRVAMRCKDCRNQFLTDIAEDNYTNYECPSCKQKNVIFVRKSIIEKLKLRMKRLKEKEKELRKFSRQNTHKKLIIDSPIIIGITGLAIEIYYHILLKGTILAVIPITFESVISPILVFLGVGRIILTYEYQSGINPFIFLTLGILILPFIAIDFLLQIIRVIHMSYTTKKKGGSY